MSDEKTTAEPVEDDPKPADEPITLEVQNLKINLRKWAHNG